VEVFAIRVRRKTRKFDLFKTIVNSGFNFVDGDIVVVSSKFVSISEGSLIQLKRVRPTSMAKKLAKKFQMNEELTELVLREADMIINGIPGFLLCIKDGMLAPNAGIDKSNAPKGKVILYPRNAFASADSLRLEFMSSLGLMIGVIISDSRLMPTRIGTTGIAVGVSGIEPVEDQRGHHDLFGKKLKVTLKAIADSLATIGVFIMGESNESTPVVVIRGAEVRFTNRKLSHVEMTIDPSNDIYLRNFSLKLKNTSVA